MISDFRFKQGTSGTLRHNCVKNEIDQTPRKETSWLEQQVSTARRSKHLISPRPWPKHAHPTASPLPRPTYIGYIYTALIHGEGSSSTPKYREWQKTGNATYLESKPTSTFDFLKHLHEIWNICSDSSKWGQPGRMKSAACSHIPYSNLGQSGGQGRI